MGTASIGIKAYLGSNAAGKCYQGSYLGAPKYNSDLKREAYHIDIAAEVEASA